MRFSTPIDFNLEPKLNLTQVSLHSLLTEVSMNLFHEFKLYCLKWEYISEKKVTIYPTRAWNLYIDFYLSSRCLCTSPMFVLLSLSNDHTFVDVKRPSVHYSCVGCILKSVLYTVMSCYSEVHVIFTVLMVKLNCVLYFTPRELITIWKKNR